MSAFYYKENKKFFVALDCIIFGFDDGVLKVLIHKRKFEPFAGEWSLFGGFLNEDESLDDGANRILLELTGLDQIYLEQLYVYGESQRDPAARVLSFAYAALIPEHRYSREHSDENGAQWFPVKEIPDLIMDHNEMIRRGLRWLRRRASSQPIGFELLPKTFTIPQLQRLYEAIFFENIDNRNFRKKLYSMNVLVKTDEKDKSGSRKGAYLYRFDRKKYDMMVSEGFSFYAERPVLKAP